MRWIVFDDQTAEAVMDKYKRGAAEIHEGAEPLDAALQTARPTVLILPSSEIGTVLLASIEPKTIKPHAKPPRKPVVAQFTPLRGVMKKPPTTSLSMSARKTWWRKSGS